MAKAVVFATVLVSCAACSGAGGPGRAATVSCNESTCTVDYPAKARPNQSSSGGPPASVFGFQTQLISISGGQALMRIAEAPATLRVGDSHRAGDVVAKAEEITDTLVVVRYQLATRTNAAGPSRPGAAPAAKAQPR